MKPKEKIKTTPMDGVAGWLLGRLRRVRAGAGARSRLELVERITLAPRQSLALIEAEGRRFLVATSPEGAPAFYALDERVRDERILDERARATGKARQAGGARVSW